MLIRAPLTCEHDSSRSLCSKRFRVVFNQLRGLEDRINVTVPLGGMSRGNTKKTRVDKTPSLEKHHTLYR